MASGAEVAASLAGLQGPGAPEAEASLVEAITLSYTMHETELPETMADAAGALGDNEGDAALN